MNTAGCLIDSIVTTERRNGANTESALYRAAQALGLSPRWVKSVYYQEAARDRAELFPRLHAHYRAYMARELARLEIRTAELRAQYEALDRGSGE